MFVCDGILLSFSKSEVGEPIKDFQEYLKVGVCFLAAGLGDEMIRISGNDRHFISSYKKSFIERNA